MSTEPLEPTLGDVLEVVSFIKDHMVMREEFVVLGEKVDSLDIRMDSLEGKVDVLGGRVDSLEGRMGSLEGKVDNLGGHIVTLEGKVDIVDGKMGQMKY